MNKFYLILFRFTWFFPPLCLDHIAGFPRATAWCQNETKTFTTLQKLDCGLTLEKIDTEVSKSQHSLRFCTLTLIPPCFISIMKAYVMRPVVTTVLIWTYSTYKHTRLVRFLACVNKMEQNRNCTRLLVVDLMESIKVRLFFFFFFHFSFQVQMIQADRAWPQTPKSSHPGQRS